MSRGRAKNPQTRAIDIIADALVNEYGWMVNEETGDGTYLHVWLDKKSGFHELTVMAPSFDQDGNGTCVMHLSHGEGEDETFDVEIAMRDWKADVSELDDKLKDAFGGGPRSAGIAEELGRAAHAAGKKRVPAQDRDLMALVRGPVGRGPDVLKAWLRGYDAEAKMAGGDPVPGNVVALPYLQNIPPEKRLDRAVEVHFKREGKTVAGIERMIRDYNKKDPEYFKDVMREKGLKTIRELAEYIAR